MANLDLDGTDRIWDMLRPVGLGGNENAWKSESETQEEKSRTHSHRRYTVLTSHCRSSVQVRVQVDVMVDNEIPWLELYSIMCVSQKIRVVANVGYLEYPGLYA